MRSSNLYQIFLVVAVFAAVGMFTSACAQTSHTSSSGGGDRVVLQVGSKKVSQGQMDALIRSLTPQAQQQVAKEGGRRSLGEQYADMLVLSQAALSQRLDSDPQFQQQMELSRDRLLAQLEQQHLLKQAAVEPGEISQFYTAHQSEFNQAQLYEVAIVKKTGTSGAGLSETEAQAKAAAIRKALSSGQSIGQVAKQFAIPNQVEVSDPQTVNDVPSLPDFVRAAFQIKVGGLSEVVDRPNALLFYQVASHSHQTLQDATPEITNLLKQQKVQAEVANLKKQTPVTLDPGYFGPPAAPALTSPQ